MAEYQNIFTQVQVRGPAYAGVPLTRGRLGPRRRSRASSICSAGSATRRSARSIWAGSGSPRSLCGFIAIEIIGLNMWASVNWDPVQFVRQLPWLALEPPAPVIRPAVLPPLNEGGWWLMAGFFLTTSILLWWVRTYRRARALGMGTHVAWAFAVGDLALSGAGLHPPAADGQLGRGGALRDLPASRLDRGVLDPLRQPVLQPVPHALDRLPLRLDAAVRDARRHRSWRSAGSAASARSSRSSTAARRSSAARCSGAGPWASTPRLNRSIAGPGGSRCSAR